MSAAYLNDCNGLTLEVGDVVEVLEDSKVHPSYHGTKLRLEGFAGGRVRVRRFVDGVPAKPHHSKPDTVYLQFEDMDGNELWGNYCSFNCKKVLDGSM